MTKNDDTPESDDVLNYPDEQRDGDRKWIVLYPEDYDNFGVDPKGNLAVLVDQEQAGELLCLTSQVIADLSHLDANGGDVIEDLIASLEDVAEAQEVDDD